MRTLRQALAGSFVLVLAFSAAAAAQEKRFEVDRKARDTLARGDGSGRERLEEQLGLTLAVERQHARHHFVHDDAE